MLTYKDFIEKEKLYNRNEAAGLVRWYRDVVGVPGHFKREEFNRTARTEASVLRRAALLDAFEHIAAMNRVYDIAEVSYTDYFKKQEAYIEQENSDLSTTLNDFNSIIFL